MPSALYHTLHATALECFNSMDNIHTPQTPTQQPQPYTISPTRIRAIRTPDYIQTYGHGHMVSIAKKGHYAPLTVDSLVTHLQLAGPTMSKLRTEVKKVVVDEVSLEVAVWMTIWITVGRGVASAAHTTTEPDDGTGSSGHDDDLADLDSEVEYEMAWFYEMVGDEGGMKVRRATEFVDGYAAERVGELIKLRHKYTAGV